MLYVQHRGLHSVTVGGEQLAVYYQVLCAVAAQTADYRRVIGMALLFIAAISAALLPPSAVRHFQRARAFPRVSCCAGANDAVERVVVERFAQERDEDKEHAILVTPEDMEASMMDTNQPASTVADELGSGGSMPMLSRGVESWGRWSQSEDFLSLELFVSTDTTAKAVRCEVAAGQVDVWVSDIKLLSGKLAQPVVGTELCWTLDDEDDDSSSETRVLCIELPKRERSIYGDPDGPFAQPLFEALQIYEQELSEVAGPGLVGGDYAPSMIGS